MAKSPSGDKVAVDTVVSWIDCGHHFLPHFGPVLHCRFCGATTIYSVDGKSKPIYPPTDFDALEKEMQQNS